MADTEESVRCLWIPLRDVNMLIPSASVAEVCNYQVPDEMKESPDWILGTICWRGETVPVISLEILCGDGVPVNLVYSRLMIINSICPDSTVRFYAIVAAGLPRLLQFDDSTVRGMEASTLEAVQCRVSVGSETAVIPDLAYIQGLLEQHRDIAA
ncbi:MAG: chemotaxis protein CheW [Gammaproteobacteria bacterium]|nr:MAG: chemotaxis protein CheW [Gammaproteobacteria bacterium]